MVILPKLLAFMAEQAPRASLRACPIPLDQPGTALASGEVDVAVGFFRNLTTGFRQSLLFRERYVCVVRADHPNFRSGMSAESFARSPRALADASGMAHTVVEDELKKQGLTAAPQLTVPQFRALPLVTANSDLLVIRPSRLAKAFSQLVSIKILEPPLLLRPYDIKIYWHERFDRDLSSRRIRKSPLNCSANRYQTLREVKVLTLEAEDCCSDLPFSDIISARSDDAAPTKRPWRQCFRIVGPPDPVHCQRSPGP